MRERERERERKRERERERDNKDSTIHNQQECKKKKTRNPS